MRRFFVYIVLAGLATLFSGCNKKTSPIESNLPIVAEPVRNTEELAFKPVLPAPNRVDVVGARDRVIYCGIPKPERAAWLVSTKYSRTIKKVAADMVRAGKLPASERQGLIDALEGIVMIESGGDLLAISPAGAVGIAQMIPDTARQFGKLKVDEAKSEILRRQILAGKTYLYPALCRVDERYDPYKCIRGGARYLVHLFGLYGRWDFVILSYHGGAGNTNDLLAMYMAGNYEDIGTYKQNIAEYHLSYQKIFFDCSPTHNPGTYKTIRNWETGLMDFNGSYYWNVVAAHRAVELYRKDKKTFRTKVHNWKNPVGHRKPELLPELIWYPPKRSHAFANAAELGQAYDKGIVVPAPDNQAVFGYILDESIGECVDEEYREPFRGAYPETIGLLMVIGYLTRRESEHWDEALTVTTLVRTTAYQKLVKDRYPSTASERSIHADAFSIDISRERYASVEQREGFQYALDYCKNNGYICYGIENHAVHITLNPRAAEIFRAIYKEGIAFANSTSE